MFIKNKPQTAWPVGLSDGARPNLLVGGFPTEGFGSDDSYEIYGNFFYENRDGEAQIQGSGTLSVYNNVFVGGSLTAINLVNHDLPLKRAYVYTNTIYGQVRGINVNGGPLQDSLVTGNLVLANQGVTAPVHSNNVVDIVANAAKYVNSLSYALGGMDFYPKPGMAKGAALEVSRFVTQTDYSRDFNGTLKGAFEYRGAYSGEGTNPGWALRAVIKGTGASSPTGDGGGTPADRTPPAKPQGLRVR